MVIADESMEEGGPLAWMYTDPLRRVLDELEALFRVYPVPRPSPEADHCVWTTDRTNTLVARVGPHLFEVNVGETGLRVFFGTARRFHQWKVSRDGIWDERYVSEERPQRVIRRHPCPDARPLADPGALCGLIRAALDECLGRAEEPPAGRHPASGQDDHPTSLWDDLVGDAGPFFAMDDDDPLRLLQRVDMYAPRSLREALAFGDVWMSAPAEQTPDADGHEEPGAPILSVD